MSTDERTLSAFRTISEAFDLIQDAADLARNGLRAEPTITQRNEIDVALIRLTQLRREFTDALRLLAFEQASVSPTPPGHLVEIKTLGAHLGNRLVQSNVTAADAADDVARALDLLNRTGFIVFHPWPPPGRKRS